MRRWSHGSTARWSRVQVDVKTTHEDGSARMAVLSVQRPDLAAGAVAEVALLAHPEGGTAAGAGPAIDLGDALRGRSFTVDIAVAGRADVQVDVLAALRDALAGGTASVWQRGELATNARVEVPLEGSQRLVFDVTAYRSGGLSVDAQFNNDRATEASGGRIAYEAVVRMDGREIARAAVDQGQYQNWHRKFSSNGTDGGQGLGDPDGGGGWLNIRHDVAKLAAIGVVADYDLSLRPPEGLLGGYGAAVADPGWGDPLASNGVTRYMPVTGGRPDIGFTTQANTAWLLTGDARAAAYAMGQAEAAGAVPWHFWDAGNGTWLSTDNYPRLWTDPRGGAGRPAGPASTGLT